MAYLLGIDIGTSGTKTLICDEDGTGAGDGDGRTSHLVPQAGWSEQNPQDWWQATCRGDQSRVCKKARIKGGRHQRRSAFPGRCTAASSSATAARPFARHCSGTISEPPSSVPRSNPRPAGAKALIELVANPALTGFTAPKILWVRAA